MRALVTGATGFIGNLLVLELRRRGWDVVCMLRGASRAGAGIQCVQGDLLQPESLCFSNIPKGSVDVLFHFAALLPSQESTPEQYLMANCLGTVRLLQTAVHLGINSLVYASSLPVIGKPEHLPITEDHPANPRHPYHLSKLCGEIACEMSRRTQGLRVSSLRITSPFGPGMSPNGVLAHFVRSALKSADIQWLGSGSRAQNFVHVSDVVMAAMLAAETDHPGIYNVGGNETTTMRELARMVAQLIPGTHSEMNAKGMSDPEEGCRWDVDLTRAASGLKYRPKISLELGLGEYIAWLRSGVGTVHWWNS
jgi:nucleoside-diphosphate-sugar epimerase